MIKMVEFNEFSMYTDDEMKSIYNCLNKQKTPYTFIHKENLTPLELVLKEYEQELEKEIKKIK